jgi:hypothetical protein
MTIGASVFVRTTILVVVNMIFRAPVPALVLSVQVNLGFSPKILPIVCIHTLISLMICFVIGAPYCFEMKHVKVGIFFKFVDHFDRYF